MKYVVVRQGEGRTEKVKTGEVGNNNRYVTELWVGLLQCACSEMSVSHLVSFAFVFREEDDGISQCGGGRLHLLHHHLSRAVDSEDVTGEVLAGSSWHSAGGA